MFSGEQIEYLERLAFVYLSTGYYRRAASLYQFLLESDPVNPRLMLGCIHALVKSGKHQQALAVLEKIDVRDFDPGRSAQLQLLESRALLGLKNRDKARAVFRKFMQREAS